jgi:hypothetical protein
MFRPGLPASKRLRRTVNGNLCCLFEKSAKTDRAGSKLALPIEDFQ